MTEFVTPPPPPDEAPAVVGPRSEQGPGPTANPASERGRRPPWLVPVLAALVALVAVGGGTFAALSGNDDDEALSSATSIPLVQTSTSEALRVPESATSESATSASTSAEPTTTAPNPLADLGDPYTFVEIPLEGGLFCRDVLGASGSYDVAVRYWYREQAPDRMDADLNGLPCETVYDAGEVAEYWSRAHPEVAVENVARWMADRDYTVTHIVDVEPFPDGTHDVKVAVDVDGDRQPDHVGLFNVYGGFDIFPSGDGEVDAAVSNALFDGRY